MSVDLEELVAPTGPRMYRKQYAIVPPGETKIVGYARATTIAKTLDDTTNLERWGKRMVAIGLTRRPDLLSTAALHTTETPDTKRALNDICEQAVIAGGGTVRRDQGTAIHKMMELAHTDPGYTVPEIHRAEIAAINTALTAHSLQVVPEFSEMICVHDRHRIAGRPDIVLRDTTTGRLLLGDLKTGSSTSYGQLAWAIQFAITANADNRYIQGAAKDGSEDQRLPMPDLDRTSMVIMHIQPGGTVCDIYDLDIARGAVALEVAMEARRHTAIGASKKTPLLVARNIVGGGAVPVDGSAPTPGTSTGGGDSGTANGADTLAPTGGATPVDHQARVDWVLTRVDHIKAHEKALADLGSKLPVGVPTPRAVRAGDAEWSPADLNTYVALLDMIEGRHGLQFGDTDPDAIANMAAQVVERVAEDEKQKLVPLRKAPFKDLSMATADQVDALRTISRTLLNDPGSKLEAAAITRWIKEAGRARRPFAMAADGEPTTLRAYTICATALELVALLEPFSPFPEVAVRAAIALAIGVDPLPANWTTGGALGSLTTAEAQRLADIAADTASA